MQEFDLVTSLLRENIDYIAKAPAALLTLAVAYFVLKGLRRVLRAAMRVARINVTIESMLLSAVGFVGWVLAAAAALNVMGLSQLSLALGGSVALVAMALATGLNNVAQDLLAGIFLLADDEFVIGRRVKAGGVEGVLEELTIRKTRIRDSEGNLHTVPNRNVDQGTYVILAPGEGEEAGGKAV